MKKQKIKKNNRNLSKKIIILIELVLITNFLFLPQLVLTEETTDPGAGDNQDNTEKEKIISDINQKIEENNQKIEELQEKIDYYNNNISIKQKEEVSLQSEIGLLESKIDKKRFDIEAQEALIEKLGLEIDDLGIRIIEKENEIDSQKTDLAVMLRKIYEYDQKTYLEIAVENSNFSDFFIQLQYLENLQGDTQESLNKLKTLKATLEDQKENLNQKKEQQEIEKEKLETEQGELEGERNFKDNLLYSTKLDEAKFQQLIEEVRQEQVQANSEITDLEREMDLRLKNENYSGGGDEIIEGVATLMWPVSPALGISCGFHCADYPFKRWFEHSAIDIRTSQGTAIAAAAAGYVTVAKNAGLGYSYILIVHGGGLATVYGHVSRIDVIPEQFVRKGDIIGLSGGTPGLPGTGKFSTGPHLHFEVRINGIPDDPLKYLP